MSKPFLHKNESVFFGLVCVYSILNPELQILSEVEPTFVVFFFWFSCTLIVMGLFYFFTLFNLELQLDLRGVLKHHYLKTIEVVEVDDNFNNLYGNHGYGGRAFVFVFISPSNTEVKKHYCLAKGARHLRCNGCYAKHYRSEY